MGWLNDKAPGHEGWLVALVRDEERGLARNDYFREMDLEDVRSLRCEAAPRPGMNMQVGCDCGWRSPRMRAPSGAEWHPFMLTVDEATEDACRALWREHLNHPATLILCRCGAPAAHAEAFYSRIRGWCEEHTPWSGHFEHCGAICRTMLARTP